MGVLNPDMHQKTKRISIIVPVLNEGPYLDHFLAKLARSPHELIVVDGGSNDQTPQIASRHADIFTVSPRGRGIQQHWGALRATGDILLFLHADTFLPPHFEAMIISTLRDGEISLGAFKLRLFPSNPWLRLVAHVANLRSALLKLPYGDQAFFMKKDSYFKVGGFRDIPIMEDVDLVRRARRAGKIRILNAHVATSARRWYKEGMVLTTLRNWSLMIRYFMGTSPSALKPHYPEVRN